MAESAAELRGRCEYDADAAYNLSFMLAQVGFFDVLLDPFPRRNSNEMMVF